MKLPGENAILRSQSGELEWGSVGPPGLLGTMRATYGLERVLDLIEMTRVNERAAEDYAVVRIEGHPAKKLCFWIRRADFWITSRLAGRKPPIGLGSTFG
jgi:hypothetical protein